jgi:hypothetical protein
LANLRTVSRASTEWIINHVLGHLLYENFKFWLKITFDNWDRIMKFERTSTETTLKSTYYYIFEQRDSSLSQIIPFYSFVLNTDEPLEFHWSHSKENELEDANRLKTICR